MKQTAVEWLIEELQKADYIPKDSIIMDYVIKQAKEMEKQQIICAYRTGKIEGIIPKEFKKYSSEKQYYNETFKNK
jgi:hypothetical protein